MNNKYLWWILGFALLRGLFYIFIVPPWQHYDEPTHFEYAHLIADRLALPQRGDFDQKFRREVAASMVEAEFFRGLDYRPNLLAQEEPVSIGISELKHPPLYYMWLAVPLRLIRHTDVVFQLHVARFVSLLLYLFSIWVAYRLVGELVGPDHILRWAVPGMMAVLPALTDLMTAVNNDVGAIAIFSLFLWGSVRLVMRGVSAMNLAWMVGTALLCLWTKNTAAIAVILAPLVVMVAARPRPWPRWVWALFLGLGAIALAAVLVWDNAAAWYRETDQPAATRRPVDLAPVGEQVFALEIIPDEPARQVRQQLLAEDVQALQGQTVTFGAWMWASTNVWVRTPTVTDEAGSFWEPVEVGVTPAFHAITATIAADAERVGVIVRPLLDFQRMEPITVYFDGLVLVEGEWPSTEPPRFADVQGGRGQWGKRTFVNRLRNGSAERAWPRFRPPAEITLKKFTRRSPTQILTSVLDWRQTGWVHRASLVTLFQTFWARFGWGHVGLPVGWYWALAGVSALALGGAVVGLARLWRSDQPLATKRAVILLLLAGLLVWAIAFLRPHPLVSTPVIPAARYAYPAIIPTVLALVVGWLTLAPPRVRTWSIIGLLAGLVFVDIVSVLTLLDFFYGR
ncbi:MAG: ArnT family glycosyltransferase [Anaerolineae bacterium]